MAAKVALIAAPRPRPLRTWPALGSQSANRNISMKPNADVTIGSGPRAVTFANRLPLAIIAGPCALESRDHALKMAGALRDIADRLGVGIVYKSSFDKANRTSAAGRRGLGLEAPGAGQLGPPGPRRAARRHRAAGAGRARLKHPPKALA